MEVTPPSDNIANDSSAELNKAPEIPQNSTLLNLPLEIFQLITRYMDTGTFLASLLVCKRFLKAADCRPSILRRVYNIPGLRLGLDDFSASQLMGVFRVRAAESGCAAGILANVTSYRQTGRLGMGNAIFSPKDPTYRDSHAYLASVREGGIIQIYELDWQDVRMKVELHIRPEDGDETRMEIIRMAFSPGSRDLAVLYRHVPRPTTTRGNKSSLFEPHPLAQKTYKLVTFHYLSASTKRKFYDSNQQETRDIKVGALEVPVGLALASDGRACIAWKIEAMHHATNITLIGRDESLMETCTYDADPHILKLQDPSNPATLALERRIFGVQFVDSDKKLNLYRPGNPVHTWFTTTCDPADVSGPPLLRNTDSVDLNIDEGVPETLFSIGMAFHGSHCEEVTVDWQSELVCQSSYLALGTTRDSHVSDPSAHPDAFILQADHQMSAESCIHEIDLNEGRKLQSWKAVALLAGWRQGTSSLGTVVAISPGGTRVAAATWSRVLMWSFHPNLLHQGELQHYFPVRDYNAGKGFGRLRPTLLSSEGVVYSMLWVDECNLYATTDRGLVRWDLGHMSEGKRTKETLESDAAGAATLALGGPSRAVR